MRGPGGRGHAQVAITASNIGDDSSPLNTNAHASAPTSPVQAPVSASFSTHNPKLSTTEKSLPPIPGSGGHYSNSSTNMKENGYSNNQPEVENPNVSPSSPTQANSAKSIPVPPNTSSSSKSFSAGSFFQSLRRLSMATLAQAVAHAPTSPTSTNINPLNTAGNNPHPNSSIPSSQVGKRHSIPSYDNRNGSGISTSGVGSRQEIEALVKQPPSLRCCMTFVNVPWTGIASLLMDHAYNHQSTIQEQ
ncbi:hypothetical protein BX616_004143 [Lobosporangium transversale]|nr:hypothetical protein BX616_004143 [Lobosporangium transversale]